METLMGRAGMSSLKDGRRRRGSIPDGALTGPHEGRCGCCRGCCALIEVSLLGLEVIGFGHIT
jgi:hypothetical protein